eukprot:GHVL01031481.1.p2 GENE.GHVL01031481.1~~GHVL01031481.1.p2  ORF type:complete len:106 (-),score=20.32 GHVL01031481.1:806-1123(-)
MCYRAEALLEQDTSLRQIRFKLVPARLNEETFWQRFFGGVRCIIRDEFLNKTKIEEDLSNGESQISKVSETDSSSSTWHTANCDDVQVGAEGIKSVIIDDEDGGI